MYLYPLILFFEITIAVMFVVSVIILTRKETIIDQSS